MLYTPGFVVWSVPGMEMPLAAFSYTALLLAMCTARSLGPLSYGRLGLMLLAVVVRPEGALLAGLMWLIEASLATKQLTGEARVRRLGALAALALLVLVLLVWRWSFYGHPLPNTFYAKAPTPALIELGTKDAKEFLEQRAIGFAPLAALLLLAFPQPLRARAVLLAFSVWFCAVLLVYTRSGGDFPGFHRFYQPMVPAAYAVLATLGSRSVELAAARVGRWKWLIHGAAAIPLGWLLYDPTPPALVNAAAQDVGKIFSQTGAVEDWRRAGRAIKAACDRGELRRPLRMATRAAGAIPFDAQADRVYDMLALNNPEVAHHNPPVRDVPAHQKEATEAQVLAWKPNLIVGHPILEMADRSGQPPHWWRSDAYEQAGFRYRCLPTERPPEHTCFYQRGEP